ncbi:MAG TPA: hypothetical protein VLS92_05655 [Acidimicrobiia bacterium]|nr:hypothetical protein [Acidimicrobiia bacterium]
MRKRLVVLSMLIGLVGVSCGDDDGVFGQGGSSTTAAAGETFLTTAVTAATTTIAVETTLTTAATTTAVPTTTTTTTVPPVVLGPTCTNESHGYTISYPVGWHVDGEEVDWNQYPSDDFACRLYGPNAFADLGEAGYGFQGWVADSAQAYVAVQLSPHLGLGSVLFQDQGYAYAADFAAVLAQNPAVTVTVVSGAGAPTWKVDGWVDQYRVYGYIVEPWAGCHPIVIGASATDEAFVLQWAPTVDAMLAGLSPAQGQPAAC